MGAYIAKTDADGVSVGPNACILMGDLDASADTVTMDYDVFQASSIVIIDQEHVTLSARGLSPVFSRGADGTTPAIHYQGARARLKGGKEVLSHTFDGATWLSQINVGADVEMMYVVEVDGVEFRPRMTTTMRLHDDFPFIRYKPAAGVTIKVKAWTWVPGNVWAEFV